MTKYQTESGYAVPTSHPDHAALCGLVETIKAIDAEIADLERDGALWEREIVEARTSGAVRDKRKVELISTLQTKVSMVPHAISREQDKRAAAVAACGRFVGPLHDAADKLFADIRTELLEPLVATLGIYVSDSERVAHLAGMVFQSSEWGGRILEAEMGRSRGVRDHGEANALAVWFSFASAIHSDWRASALRATTVPAAE